MVQRSGWRSHVAALLASVGAAFGLVVACSQLQGSLGAQCLKDADCLSGICSEFRCVTAPPLLDGSFVPEAATASGEGGLPPETDGAPVEDAPPVVDDSSTPDVSVPDALAIPADAPVDAPSDAIVDTPLDAPFGDAPSDAAGDARDDAGDTG
jgi:hypothetical protein